MLVSNWAQDYWAVSAVAKKTLHDYQNVFGRVVEPFIGSKDLGEVSFIGIQKLVLATTPRCATPILTKWESCNSRLYGQILWGDLESNETLACTVFHLLLGDCASESKLCYINSMRRRKLARPKA